MVNSNPMLFLEQMLSMGNPQMVVQNMIRQNPQAKIIFNQLAQSGMSTKDFVLQYAKQHNIDLNPLIQVVSRNGIQL